MRYGGTHRVDEAAYIAGALFRTHSVIKKELRRTLERM
jgi:hypothetical protein